MSSFQKSIERILKSVTHIPKEKQATEIACESTQMSVLADFKTTIINMFEELKEIMLKKVTK